MLMVREWLCAPCLGFEEAIKQCLKSIIDVPHGRRAHVNQVCPRLFIRRCHELSQLLELKEAVVERIEQCWRKGATFGTHGHAMFFEYLFKLRARLKDIAQ